MLSGWQQADVAAAEGDGATARAVDAGGDGTLVLDGNDPNTIFFGGPADRGLVGISQISFASGQHDLSVSLGDVSNGVTLDGFGSGDTLRLSSNLSGSYLIFSSAS